MKTAATIVYLYVRIISNNGYEDSRTAYASMAACVQAAQSARVVVGNGADNEATAVIWCGGPRQKRRVGEWSSE